MVLSATTGVEPVTSGKWAPYQRPVRPSAGVYTEWNCDKLRDGGDALVTAVPADRISRARAGDGNAFRELTEPHRRELQVHCYRMLGSLQDAEDALQDTLLAAWQGFGGFEGARHTAHLALPNRDEPVPQRPSLCEPTTSQRVGRAQR